MRSALPIIDYALIVDTGSTDGTPELIERFLAANGVPGRVHHHEWRGFADARTVALAQMREVEHIDYALMIDADDVLSFSKDVAAFKQDLVSDVCWPSTVLDGLHYLRSAFISNRRPFFYAGVVHEELYWGGEFATYQTAFGLTVTTHPDSHRAQDPMKFRKDADALIAAFATEPNEVIRRRYTYYIGQCLRDHAILVGDLTCYREARHWYQLRAEFGGVGHEPYFANMMVATCADKLGEPIDEVLEGFRRAIALEPDRAEAPFEASRACVSRGDVRRAHEFAQLAATATRPAPFYQQEGWIYDWGAQDQLAATTFMNGDAGATIALIERILADAPNIPDHERQRMIGNLDHAIASLKAATR
ncbi:tetratricopeptide repeat-containing glycosyltransferase [Sphingomonas cavernae]|uniref:tetratricopeptide repeat-containing glycosyltransferase n=1 Tax=Sphingomonas cavernae TaxID=2320861 RepID=UPI001603459F|nr:glycosyltransferase [Sphingomonas cavernae]